MEDAMIFSGFIVVSILIMQTSLETRFLMCALEQSDQLSDIYLFLCFHWSFKKNGCEVNKNSDLNTYSIFNPVLYFCCPLFVPEYLLMNLKTGVSKGWSLLIMSIPPHPTDTTGPV